MALWKKVSAILIGSVFIAMGVNLYLVPFKVLDGGLIGIALIANYLLGAKIGLTIMLCSIPIFMLAWRFERHYFFNSLHGMVISSFFIDILYPLQFHFLYLIELNPVASSMVGGSLVGAGLGIMLRYETSTGGTDLLAHLLSKATHWNIGLWIFMIDGAVVAIGGILISVETLLLSILSIAAGGVMTYLLTLRR